MTLPPDMGMDIDNNDNFLGNIANNYDEVRGHTMAPDKQASRTVSMSSSEASVDYATRLEHLNDLLKDENLKKLIDSSQLLYTMPREHGNQVSTAANSNSNMRQQCVPIGDPVLNNFYDLNNNVFNVQLPYDINQALDLKSWDGNFHAILLHGFLEHLVSDVKHIKESLKRMQKYILNKSINGDKANDIKDLEGVGKAAWWFISVLYKFH